MCYFFFVLVVAFMAFSLVGIKVYNHKSIYAMPFLHISCYESYVRIDTEPTTTAICGVIEASTKVDSQAMDAGHTGSLDTTQGCALHGFKKAHSEQLSRQREWHFHCLTHCDSKV